MDQALPGQANLYVWVTLLVVVAAVFTITGGLTAVMWTDTIQTAIMLIGAFVLMILSFQEVTMYSVVGGQTYSVDRYARTSTDACTHTHTHARARAHDILHSITTNATHK